VIDAHQVGLSLAFVIYESANPHMGEQQSQLMGNMDVGIQFNLSNHKVVLSRKKYKRN
jgi:hypothetical protein